MEQNNDGVKFLDVLRPACIQREGDVNAKAAFAEERS